MRAAYQRQGAHFAERILTAEEWAYCQSYADPTLPMAARFAAKEAARKALSAASGLSWHDVEVIRSPRGPVSLRFAGKARDECTRLKISQHHLSLSHERDVAVATVILER